MAYAYSIPPRYTFDELYSVDEYCTISDDYDDEDEYNLGTGVNVQAQSGVPYNNLGTGVNVQAEYEVPDNNLGTGLNVQAEYEVPYNNLGTRVNVQAQSGVSYNNLGTGVNVQAQSGVPYNNLGTGVNVQAQPGVPYSIPQRYTFGELYSEDEYCTISDDYDDEYEYNLGTGVNVRAEYEVLYNNLGTGVNVQAQSGVPYNNLGTGVNVQAEYEVPYNNLGTGVNVQAEYEVPYNNLGTGVNVQAEYEVPYNNLGTGVNVQAEYEVLSDNIGTGVNVQANYSTKFGLANVGTRVVLQPPSLKDECDHLKAELCEKEAKMEDMKTEIANLQNRIYKAGTEMEDKKREIVNLQRSEETYRTTMHEMEILNNRKEQEVKISKTEKETNYRKKTDLKDRIAELTNEMLILEDRLQSEEKTNRELRETISRSEEKYTSDISEMEILKNRKEQDVTDLEARVRDLKRTNNELECRNEDTMTDLQAMTNECHNLKAELREKDVLLTIKITELENNETESTNLQNRIDKAGTEIEDKKREILNVQRSEATYLAKLQEMEILKHRKEQDVKDSVARERVLKKTIHELECRNEDTKADLQSKTNDCDHLKDELREKDILLTSKITGQENNETEIANLQNKIDKAGTEIEDKKREILNLQRSEETCRLKLQEIEIFKNRKEQDVKDSEARERDLKWTNNELECRNEDTKIDLQAMIEECDNLKAELREEKSSHTAVLAELQDLRRKSVTRVKLFCHRRVNTVSDFENDLVAQLKSKVETEHKELVFEQLTDPKDADDSDTVPTIVLCLTTSSIEMDAKNGVQGLQLSSKKALLIIHHKEPHALPQQSSERVLTGQKFKNLGCIFDMAFLSEKGIFKCELNTNSVLKLVSFIRKEGVEQRKY